MKSCHTKIISENIVGHLPSESEDTLHLFLMPHLHGYTFDVYVLEELTSKNIGFNQKNVYCNTHITEGKYEFKNPSQTNKEILNHFYYITIHKIVFQNHTPPLELSIRSQSLFFHPQNVYTVNKGLVISLPRQDVT